MIQIKIVFNFLIITNSFFCLNAGFDLIRLGTDYGGWTIPQDLLNEDSICYLAGAGLDISFDLAIIQRYGCKVYTIDPTPGAIQHIDYLKLELEAGRVPYTNHGSKPYDCMLEDLSSIYFLPYGLWHENIIMKFYSPKNSQHISHSILNLQKTDTFFEAQCKTLATVMKELGHNSIDLLKLDIEGAEYSVIESLIADNIDVRCICLEFDEFAGVNFSCNKDREGSKKRVDECIQLLQSNGYEIIYENGPTDMTFLKKTT